MGEDIIADFLNQEIPLDWEQWTIFQRRTFFEGNANYKGETKPRNKVCILEIWLEALEGVSINRISLADKRVIRDVLARLENWEKSTTAMGFGNIYGVQKGYMRH